MLVAAAELVKKTRKLKQHRWLSTPRQALLFLACFAAGAAPALILEPRLFWLAAGLIAGLGLGLVQSDW